MVNKILPLFSYNQIAHRVWSGLVASLSTVNNRCWHFKLTFNFSEPGCYFWLGCVETMQNESSLNNFHTVLCGAVSQSCTTLCDPMVCTYHTPPPMGFSRQDYWSGLPCLPARNLPDLGIESKSLTPPALAGRFLPLAPEELDRNS